MNYIVFSENEGFREGAEKIKKEALLHGKPCEIIEIGNIAKDGTLGQGVLVYFLTNSGSVLEGVRFFKKEGSEIVNERALLGDVSKFSLQEKLRSHNIHVPRSALIGNRQKLPEELQYPIFVKSQRQASIVICVENKEDLEKQPKEIPNLNEYYFEQAIGEGFLLQKFYYIEGKSLSIESIYKDAVPEWLCLILKEISQVLDLEVFSADIFIDWATKNYYCIDINPASSFFMSDDARLEFVRSILI